MKRVLMIAWLLAGCVVASAQTTSRNISTVTDSRILEDDLYSNNIYLGHTSSGHSTIEPSRQVVGALAWVNVKDFAGAKGDGVTDDTTAIVAAIAAVAPGGTVYFPSGTYLTNSLPDVGTNGLRVIGDGAGNTVIKLKNNATHKTRLMGFTGTDVTISDLALDANAANNMGGMDDTLYLGGDRAMLQRIRLSGSVYMDVQVGGNYISILDSTFIGDANATPEAGYGIWSLHPANSGLTISGNIFLNHRLSGIFASQAGMRITSNYFKGNHFQTSPTGGGQIAYGGRGTIIADNFIDAGGGKETTGIEANAGALIVWNMIQKQGRSGIYLQDGAGYTISGNIIKNNNTAVWGGAGINIGATNPISDVKITGNKIYDDQRRQTQQYGILVASTATKLTITGNDLRGNKLGALKDSSTTTDKQISANLTVCPKARWFSFFALWRRKLNKPC